MTAADLVSVVIPAYNAERYLGEAIESVLGQTHPQIETLVVDDGSEDETFAVARAYGDRIRLARRQNGDIGAARNTGVLLAHGSYFSFVYAGDRCLPDKVERQLAALRDAPELDMVFGHVREFVSPELPPEAQADVRPPAPPSPWVAPNTMLVRRTSFGRVGPFVTNVRVGEGVDWYARAIEAGLKGLTLSGDRARASVARFEHRHTRTRFPLGLSPGRAVCARTAPGAGTMTLLPSPGGARVKRGRSARSFWPSPQQRLLLETALGDATEMLAAWDRLRPAFDLQTIEDGSFATLPLGTGHSTMRLPTIPCCRG